MDNKQPSPARTRRRRWLIGATVGCLLVAAAIIMAGVLGSQRTRQQRRPSGAIPADSTSNNILEALAQLNTMPMPRPDEQAEPSAVPTGSDAGPPTGGAPGMTFSDHPGPVEGISTPFGTLKDLITGAKAPAAGPVAPPGSLTTGGGVAIGGGRNVLCYPKNGTEVIEMSGANSACTIIVLTRSSQEPYTIKQTMNITTTKVFVGNPIDMPALNSSKIERLFYVGPGGRLDIRAVTLYRGSGRRLDDGRLKLTIGGTVYVALGGSFTATGCLFRDQDQTLSSAREEMRHMLDWRSRTFGGVIFVAGGNVYLNGCYFIRVRLLGNFIQNSVQVGRDILVIAGNVVLSGVFNLNVNLFGQNVIVGNVMAVLGGTASWVGGTLCNVAGAQAQWGAGIQMFVGGGVLFNAGFNYVSANGALMRGSFGLFSVGGGVHIQTGYQQARAWAVGSINNAGQTFSVGGGIHQIVGGATATSSIANVFFGAGGTSFVGSGQLRWIGVAQARGAVAQTQYGAGLHSYNGAGTTIHIACPTAAAQLARAQFCAGNDLFLGAGWHTSVNNTRFAAQLVNAFYGVGNQIYVGAGGAAFIRNYVSTRRLVGYSTTAFQYTVAGTGVTRTQGMANVVVTKNGQHLLPFQPSPNKPKRTLQQQQQQQQQQQARVRTLTAREQEAALATDDSLAVRLLAGDEGRSKLLVAQTYMSEGKSELIVEDPKLFQAPALKDVWGGLPMLLAKQAATEASSSSALAEHQPSPGLISVNNTDCVLCSVAPGATADHQGGPESCHVSDACAGADSPMAALEAARAAAPAGFDVSSGVPGLSALSKRGTVDDEEGMELPGVWMLWHELVVYCRPTDSAAPSSSSITDGGCLSATYIKDIVRVFLGPEHADDYQLAVASTEVHAAVKPLVEADAGLLAALAMQPPRREDAGCQGWTKFNVYMTANDREVEEYLTREWQVIVADPSDLEATLLQNAPEESSSSSSSSSSNKVTPCAITVKRAGVAKYPSLQNMKGFKPLTSVLAPVGPSVTLASDAAIAPVAEVTEGQAYKVYVQNFMKGAKLSLQLVKGLDRSGPVVATVESFEDESGGGSGVAELRWVPPPGLKEREQPGQINKYYLKASVDSFPALFANSQPFILRAAAAPH